MWRIGEAPRKHRTNRVKAAAEPGMRRVSLDRKRHRYGLSDRPGAGG